MLKKTLLLTLIAISILIIAPHKLHAVDITIGATTWFAWVDQEYTKNLVSSSDTENTPAFLYGPAASVKFNSDFNLTFIFLYGQFKIEEKTPSYLINYNYYRYDSDLALNYRLNDYFKIFCGIKYMYFGNNVSKNASLGSGSAGFVYKFEHEGLGPGAGISSTYPVLENLFLLTSLSGFYIWGEETKGFIDASYSKRSIKSDCNDYGINFNLSLAYYIAPASTTIILGGRYQYIKTDYDKAYTYYTNDSCTFYGATLTATYTFSI